MAFDGKRFGSGADRFPAARPLPVQGGLSVASQRGEMAETWWSKRFIAVLESYAVGGRMPRGRRYARDGQVISLDIRAGLLVAQVQGSRPAPYVVTVSASKPSAAQWAALQEAFTARIGLAAHLLAGEVPPELETVFRDAGVALLPMQWSDLRAECSCPDWESPCKHVAAALYVFADRLDRDPWLLLAWRGRAKEELLAPLRAALGGADGPGGAAAGSADEVAPWWPFPPGPVAVADPGPRAEDERDGPLPPALPLGDTTPSVLRRLGPLPLGRGERPVAELFGGLYRAMTEPSGDGRGAENEADFEFD